jgi:hypothetical protein
MQRWLALMAARHGGVLCSGACACQLILLAPLILVSAGHSVGAADSAALVEMYIVFCRVGCKCHLNASRLCRVPITVVRPSCIGAETVKADGAGERLWVDEASAVTLSGYGEQNL